MSKPTTPTTPPYGTKYSRTDLAYLAAIADMTNCLHVNHPERHVLANTSELMVRNLAATFGGEYQEGERNNHYWDMDLPTREYLLRLVLKYKLHRRGDEYYLRMTDTLVDTILFRKETPYPFD